MPLSLAMITWMWHQKHKQQNREEGPYQTNTSEQQRKQSTRWKDTIKIKITTLIKCWEIGKFLPCCNNIK